MRHNLHQQEYGAFLAASEERRLKRAELKTRNKVWQEARHKTLTRVGAIDAERKQLLQKMDAMQAAQENYDAMHGVDENEERDEEIKGRWEAYLSLETDELDL